MRRLPRLTRVTSVLWLLLILSLFTLNLDFSFAATSSLVSHVCWWSTVFCADSVYASLSSPDNIPDSHAILILIWLTPCVVTCAGCGNSLFRTFTILVVFCSLLPVTSLELHNNSFQYQCLYWVFKRSCRFDHFFFFDYRDFRCMGVRVSDALSLSLSHCWTSACALSCLCCFSAILKHHKGQRVRKTRE